MAVGDFAGKAQARSEIARANKLIEAGLLESPEAIQSQRDQAALGLIRSSPALSGAFAGDAAQTPAAQGLLGGLTSADPVAQGLGQAGAQEIGGRTQGLIDFEQAGIERGDLNRMRELQIQGAEQANVAAKNQAAFGFDSPEKAFAFGSQADQLGSTIDSLSTQIKIREDLGAIDPVNYLTNPDAVAAIQLFDDFEVVQMFRDLADDERVTDDDRDFYRGILKFGFTDWLTSGGKVNLSKLNSLRARLRSQREVLAKSNPAGAARFADKFIESDKFGDLPGGQPLPTSPGFFETPTALTPTQRATTIAR